MESAARVWLRADQIAHGELKMKKGKKTRCKEWEWGGGGWTEQSNISEKRTCDLRSLSVLVFFN